MLVKRFIFTLSAAIISLCITQSAVATEPSSVNYAGRLEMNGYSLKQFKGFEKKWQLVTVRFRRDTGEMRFTYANPKAYATIMSGKSDYPNGAVFAKIGFGTSDDPAFTSSVEPSRVIRYQFMVKDSKKHADTGGWGFSTFNDKGKTFPDEPKLATQACLACHLVVRNRGDVFSRPVQRVIDKTTSTITPAMLKEISYKDIPRAQLPALIQQSLPPQFTSVLSIDGDLKNNLFQGTLDEIRPLLSAKVKATGKAAGLISADGKRFTVIYPDKDVNFCTGTDKSGITMTAYFSVITANPSLHAVKQSFCYSQ